MRTSLENFDVSTPDGVAHPAAALVPPAPRGAVLFLYGGGGSCETLVESRRLWESWMEHALLPPVVVATATVLPFGFYLDTDERLEQTLFAESLPAALVHRYGVAKPALLGISMGGHAAFALLFSHPLRFGPLSVLQPMVEPGWHPDEAPPHCRSHYPPGIPSGYLAQPRDPSMWRRYHPAWLARRAGERIAAPLRIEAAEQDRFHAQEGAQFVHGVLNDLGVPHVWKLTAGADHVGDTVVPRLTEAVRWLGSVW